MRLVVSDTTPLNYLILIEAIEVLPKLFGKIFVPPAVLEEMKHPKAPPIVAAWAHFPPAWVEIQLPRLELRLRLGTGETEAIALVEELADAVLLVDDKKARAIAKERGITVIGTVNLLDLADERELLDFERAISRLSATTFRVESSFLKEVLHKVRRRKVGNSDH
jgi:predicted nucleic acid-binding protein